MVSCEWRMGDVERTIHHSPFAIRHSLFAYQRPDCPCQLSKRLKTLKTVRASYWLELAWIWDRRHVRGRCHVYRFIHQGRPKAGPEIRNDARRNFIDFG